MSAVKLRPLLIVEDDPGTQAFRRCLAVPTGKKRQGNSGGPGRVGIDLAVTDEKRLAWAHTVDRGTQRGRVRLALGQGVAANDDREMSRKAEMLQDRPRRTFRLVGADRKLVTHVGKLRESRWYRRI